MFSATYKGVFAHGRRAAIVVAVFVLAGFAADTAWAIKIMDYNLLDYVSGRVTQFQTVLNAVQPDVLVVQEINSPSAVNYFRDTVLNGAGGPGGYAAATYTDNGALNNALFYRTATITYAGSSDHTTLPTSPRITDRWRLGLVGGDVYFYVYGMHLAATDPDSRLAQCTIVRNDANAFPTGTHFLMCGDFNIDSSSEASYLQLTGSLADDDGRAFDPINMPGVWHANYAFRAIHTQCPHLDNPNPPPGSVGGGMDDRFDFALISAALQDGQGLDYVSGTYKAYGNDGLHFNADINDAPIIPEGSVMADALHSASDHLPVVLELTAPPIITVPTSLSFGTMIVGASSPDNEKVLTVQNGATPPALDLIYTFSTVPTGFTVLGGTGPFTLSPGASRPHTISVSTAAAGYPQGTLAITNNSATSPKNVSLMGTVKRHAVPSTSSASQILTAPLDFGNHPIGGFTNQTAQVYNQGYTSLQSLLQIYAYDITGQDAARFSLVGFSPTNVTSTPASFTVHFDDTSAPVGAFSAALQFSTRDDTTLPGWTDQPAVTFNLSASIGLKGDMNGSGAVEEGDIPDFVSVLLDPASATASQRWLADMSNDSLDDGIDCQLFVNALLGL